MKPILYLYMLLGLILAGPGLAEETAAEATRSPEALELLKQADAAIKKVTSVSYQVTSQPSGIAENFGSAAQGESIMVGWNGATPDKFYSHVETQRDGETVELTAGGNGDMYFIIDHQTKKAYEDMDPGVLGSSARALQGLGMVEYVHDNPFDDELDADAIELREEVAVAGEECYQIHVTYAGGRGESTWFFAKKDLLPRRRVRHFSIPGQGAGSIEINVSKLETNLELDESLFVLKLPEGYEQIDDFAP